MFYYFLSAAAFSFLLWKLTKKLQTAADWIHATDDKERAQTIRKDYSAGHHSDNDDKTAAVNITEDEVGSCNLRKRPSETTFKRRSLHQNVDVADKQSVDPFPNEGLISNDRTPLECANERLSEDSATKDHDLVPKNEQYSHAPNSENSTLEDYSNVALLPKINSAEDEEKEHVAVSINNITAIDPDKSSQNSTSKSSSFRDGPYNENLERFSPVLTDESENAEILVSSFNQIVAPEDAGGIPINVQLPVEPMTDALFIGNVPHSYTKQTCTENRNKDLGEREHEINYIRSKTVNQINALPEKPSDICSNMCNTINNLQENIANEASYAEGTPTCSSQEKLHDFNILSLLNDDKSIAEISDPLAPLGLADSCMSSTPNEENPCDDDYEMSQNISHDTYISPNHNQVSKDKLADISEAPSPILFPEAKKGSYSKNCHMEDNASFYDSEEAKDQNISDKEDDVNITDAHVVQGDNQDVDDPFIIRRMPHIKRKPACGVPMFGNALTSELKSMFKKREETEKRDRKDSSCTSDDEDPNIETIKEESHIPDSSYAIMRNVSYVCEVVNEPETGASFDEEPFCAPLSCLTKDRPKPPQSRKASREQDQQKILY